MRGFDGGAVTRQSVQGHPVGYNFTAAEDSFVRVKAFLDRYMGTRAN
jgi:hypothetical protein